MSATPSGPPYRIVGRPGPGLARVADRRDGTTRLWARTLRGGAVPRKVPLPPCANCGADLRGSSFYKPPQLDAPIADRLCLACVEGAAAWRP